MEKPVVVFATLDTCAHCIAFLRDHYATFKKWIETEELVRFYHVRLTRKTPLDKYIYPAEIEISLNFYPLLLYRS